MHHKPGLCIFDKGLKQFSKILEVRKISELCGLYQLVLDNRSPTSWYSPRDLHRYYPCVNKSETVEILFGDTDVHNSDSK